VGKRLAERGRVALLQPGRTRPSRHDYRLGHLLEALFAAHLNRVYSAVALRALEGETILTPWVHPDTTPLARSGASAEDPQTLGAPRPAYGQSTNGRDDLTQVLRRLGVRGAGGLP